MSRMTLLKFGLLLLMVSLLSIPNIGAVSLTVSTDKYEYYRGETVTISVSGGTPNDVYMLQIEDPAGNKVWADQGSFDSNGAFQYQIKIPEDWDYGIYTVRIKDMGKNVVDATTFRVKSVPVPPPPPPPLTPEEVEAISIEEAVERLEGLTIEDAAEILEEVSPERAAEILEHMDLERAANITESLSVERAAEVLQLMDVDRAANLIGLIDVDRAADIMEELPIERAANITEAGIGLGLLERFANVTLAMNRTRAAELALELDVEDAADLLEEMVDIDPRGAAEVVEEAFEEDPEGTAERLGEMDVEPLTDLILAIFGLPSTPQTAAQILETLSLEKAVEVVRAMMEREAYDELAEIFRYVSTPRLNEIYGSLTLEERSTLYPHLTAETKVRLSKELLPLPDLTPITLEVKPSEPTAGETCTITVVVKNIGNGVSTSFTLTVRAEGEEVGSATISALDVGETASKSFKWTPEKAGTYTITATVDPENAVEELVEENNMVEKRVTVKPKPLPDLTVEFSSIPEKPVAGKEYSVEVLVKNIGEADAEAFNVELKLDETSLGVEGVEGLSAGGSTTVSFIWKPEKAGTYTLTAIVDPEDAIVEEDETNNRASTTVTVTPPPIVRMMPWIIAAVIIVIIIVVIAIYLMRKR